MNRGGQRDSEQGSLAFLAGGGEMGERTRTFDWSKTSVGPVSDWPQSLKIAVRIMLDSRYAMWLGWGPDFTFFYNDAYARMTLGPKHPWALGRPAREVWSEIWQDIGPRAESVVRTGQATWDEGLLLYLQRRGHPEETYHTFSYSPLPDDAGGVGGMLCVVTEDTERTIGERRLRTLRELAARTTDEPKSTGEACQTAARTLAENPRDLPFVLIYLLDADHRCARLAGATGLPEGSPAAPASVELAGDDGAGSGWPFAAVLESGRAEVVTGLEERFGLLRCEPWPEPPHQAVVVPMAKAGQPRPAGFVIAGVSPRLVFNDGYKGFIDLLAGHVATAVANARAYEEERQRAEALAELDRAKTAFFSNVSHEFRTPLTLMLGPVEDMLARSHTELSPAAKGHLEVVNRNGMRLLRLVNTLLDFSRIEAGRVRALYQPTDLAVFTADLASVFRSACERAGLRLTVDCPPLGEPVFVDRDMWEKVVLNLMSNAFKFTFEGEIAVTLRQVGRAAELRVRDTGTGIPADEMPRLFERFHRVENARGRTHEGSGIGLALVQELVKLHGGTISAESAPGQGSTFVVTVPLGSAHLPPGQIGEGRAIAPAGSGAGAFVEEALRWLPDGAAQDEQDSELPPYPEALPAVYQQPGQVGADERPRVLVADDNADMRQYLVRLLAGRYQTEAVPDGEAALAAIRQRAPDLILTDVMMPRLDGFGLLRQLRSDPRTSGLPAIMLSARAGEESRVEGMEAGADDYLVKPFSARELLARVGALLQITRLRRESERATRRSEERERHLLAEAATANAKFRAFFDQGPLYAGLLALDGTLLEVNRLCLEACGFTKEQVIGKKFWDCPWWSPSPELTETIRAGAARAAAGEPYRGEMPYFVADGSRRVVDCNMMPIKDESGRVMFLALTGTDVTDRKRAEQELAEAHKFLHSSIDALSSHIAVLDENGVILAVNDAWRRFADENNYGGRNYGVGSNYVEECEPSTGDCVDGGEVAAGLSDVLHGRADYFEMEYPCHSPTVQRWFIMRVTRFKPPGPVRVVVSHEDVTKRKKAEAALKEADRRKDEFLATLAHELRNPLAPLRNGLQIMRLAAGDRAIVEEARAMMERQLGQMVHLVDDLLDLSRISRGKITLRTERVELARVVQQAVETSRPLIDAGGHTLTIDAEPRPIFVQADTNRLAQVISNLLNNAAKYTERGGHITLRVGRRGAEAVVSVRDTGVGIPAHMLPKVFEIFTQVDQSLEKSQGGLGIGLSLVKGLIELHGGTVEAHSDGRGTGSEFVVRLPVALTLAGPREGEEADEAPAAAARRILVADDNRDSAASLAKLLRVMGNDTRTANDGLEALEVGAVFRPDVILLDIGMPRLNGYETARRIRQQPWGKNVVLVAQTGWGQDDDRRKSREAGFDLHMVKPVDPNELERLLAELRAETA